MNVQQCDLRLLPRCLKSAAEDACNFQMVIIDGSVNALFKAISDFRSHAGAPLPRLVLLSADSLEQANHLRADAILPTPVRAKILCETLCGLVAGATVQPPPAQTALRLPAVANGLRVLVTDEI